jgi:hypothetical protein
MTITKCVITELIDFSRNFFLLVNKKPCKEIEDSK